jgi:ribosomal protein S13
MRKMLTEGNIDYEALSDYSYKKEVLSYRDSLKPVDHAVQGDETKEGLRSKKAARSTGKTLELIG